MNKLIYYRPYQREAELLTASQMKHLIKLWGTKDKPYNHFEAIEEDHNYGTGLHDVTEILATIQCNQRLNARLAELVERIKTKGIKESNANYAGESKTVEAGIMCKIVSDAINLYNKDVDKEDEIKDYKFPIKEVYRLFSIPYKSIMDKAKKDEENIGVIEKPKKIHKVKYEVSWGGDQQSCYKYYYVKGELSFEAAYDEKVLKKIYDKFPYLGKLYDCNDGEIQIYLYDYNKRDWGFQNVIGYLKQKGYIELKK